MAPQRERYIMKTVKYAKARLNRVAARNTRYGFHGLRPLGRPEMAYDLWAYRNPSGAVGYVAGYQVEV